MKLSKLSPDLKKELNIRKQRFAESIKKKGLEFFCENNFKNDFASVLLFSEFISSSITKNPEILIELIKSKDLTKSYQEKNEYEKKFKKNLLKTSSKQELKNILCTVKLREMIRIAWRDLTFKAPLEETLKDLSNLAEVCVNTGISFLYDKLCTVYGTPFSKNGEKQKIIVLGMGKLGARELNFSSDVDLIFVYPKEGKTKGQGKSILNQEFFTKLCINFLKLFDSTGNTINLFRLDIRLRPFGENGPLIMNSSAMKEYYQTHGREWERYALIKARPVAGDIKEGYKLLKILNPFIYCRYFDYGTFASFREMKKKISLQVKKKKFKNNIKHGTGGIREIEFLGQIFQMLRGGVEPELQELKILKVLDILRKRGDITRKANRALKKAYIFLRMTENRLQEYADLQTHDLPQKYHDKLRLALSMNFDTWDNFFAELNKHTEKVHQCFNSLFVFQKKEIQTDEINNLKYLWKHINDLHDVNTVNTISEFKNPDKIIRLLRILKHHRNTEKLTIKGRNLLNELVPIIIKNASKQKNSEIVLTRLIDLVITIERRTCYLSLFLEKPKVVETLAKLAQKSSWIISFLSNHPTLLDQLLDKKILYISSDKYLLKKELNRRMAQIPESDFEFQLEELCVFKQIHTLHVAVADISQNYPLMRVSDCLTYIAETILNKVVEIVWNKLAEKYGSPTSSKSYDAETCGFAAIAYGKLGGIELGYNSDMDLVFIHAGSSGQTKQGKKNIKKSDFYTLLGQRIITALTMHTSAGTLYKTDMRLRPSGRSGMIVSHINAFKEYITKQAWTWEHQAIVRARPINGDKNLQNSFNKIRKKILMLKRDDKILKKEVRLMRKRIREEHLKPEKKMFDLKQGEGGIIDIEFLVQYLVLKESHYYPVLTTWTDNVRLIETLAKKDILSQKHAKYLKKSYLLLRKSLHLLNLKEKRAKVSLNDFFETSKKIYLIYKENLYNTKI
ncbi:MAG: bifunctional glutamine synthetase adenylyltransferase/deadenyltransferase [Desulfobacteraceae bacterium 4572_130]|nr:MAG: bifunctional glutamine synthetase adenylyltransferase/deadenyltransferase [Desulfobacteraceae bacterium 4572_130]